MMFNSIEKYRPKKFDWLRVDAVSANKTYTSENMTADLN